MARDPQSLLIREWAANGGEVNLQTPEAAGLDRSLGWTPEYSEDKRPERRVLNKLLRENTAGLREIFRKGILDWHPRQFFEHPAVCQGSNLRLYSTVQDSGPRLDTDPDGVDPTTDSAGTYWTTFASRLAFADATALRAGSAVGLLIDPATLLAALFSADTPERWRATDDRYGLVQLGTQTEINANSGDVVVTGQTLGARLAAALAGAGGDGVLGSATLEGNDLVFTISDGTTVRASLATLISGLITAVNASTGLLGGATSGTATLRVDFATPEEAIAGTSTTKAVTPAGLKAAIDAITEIPSLTVKTRLTIPVE